MVQFMKRLSRIAGKATIFGLVMATFFGVYSLGYVPTAYAADIYESGTYTPDQSVVTSNGVDWTGFYAGLHVGYGWGDQDNDFEIDGVNVSDVSNFLSHEPKGFLFGATVGLNYQVPGTRIVAGFESDWSFANHDERNSIDVDGFGPWEELFSTTEINSIGTSRLRAGYLVDPRTLVYATGGVAWASVKTSVGLDDNDIGADYSVSAVEEDTNVGWTLGAGIEYKLDHIWSVKADYLYVDLADTEHSVHFGDHTVTLTDDLTEHMVRIGVNATLY